MIKPMMNRALLAAALVFAIPFALHAQQAAPSQAGAPSEEEVAGWLQEMQQVHLELETIQARALQDPDLSAAQEALGEEIREAMEEIDPQLHDRIARVESLEGEAAQAQEAGNAERLEELMAEAQQIQQHFMVVQSQVLETPAVASKVDDFQQQLESKMVEVDPEAAGLIARFRELETKLGAVMGG